MGITLANFQLKAIEALMEAMGEPNRDIILKSCTGSGKTIILTHFMDEYLKSTNKAVFVWLTPGKGNLELQSKAKMDKYIHGSNTKLLSDILHKNSLSKNLTDHHFHIILSNDFWKGHFAPVFQRSGKVVDAKQEGGVAAEALPNRSAKRFTVF